MLNLGDGKTKATSPKVLIVEDNQDLSFLMSTKLKQADCDCAIAPTLSGARGLLESSEFDFVLLDLVLSDGSGRDFLDDIGARPKDSRPKVIITSGNVTAEMRTDPRIYKIHEKPYMFSNLIDDIYMRER